MQQLVVVVTMIWLGCLALCEQAQADGDALFWMLQDAVSAYHGGADPGDVTRQLWERMESYPDIRIDSRMDNKHMIVLGPTRRPEVPDIMNEFASHAWYMLSHDGTKPKIIMPVLDISQAAAQTPAGHAMKTQELKIFMEEITHAWEKQLGRERALSYAPGYRNYLHRNGATFDSEALVTALLDEFAMPHSLPERSRYPSRMAYRDGLSLYDRSRLSDNLQSLARTRRVRLADQCQQAATAAAAAAQVAADAEAAALAPKKWKFRIPGLGAVSMLPGLGKSFEGVVNEVGEALLPDIVKSAIQSGTEMLVPQARAVVGFEKTWLGGNISRRLEIIEAWNEAALHAYPCYEPGPQSGLDLYYARGGS